MEPRLSGDENAEIKKVVQLSWVAPLGLALLLFFFLIGLIYESLKPTFSICGVLESHSRESYSRETRIQFKNGENVVLYRLFKTDLVVGRKYRVVYQPAGHENRLNFAQKFTEVESCQ
jgi:hypothetical protein